MIALLALAVVVAFSVGNHTATATPAAQPVAVATPAPSGSFNRLKIGTQLELTAHIHTVHQAAQYILVPTGYRLVVPRDGLEDARRILNRAPSAQARNIGYTTIDTALLFIAGSDVRLVVDHANRLVSFELMD